jgi:TRAP-type C4-dicarboxylate transport system substrate-binding protein
MLRTFIIAAATLLLCGQLAQAAEVTELRYATAAPEKTPWGAFMIKTNAVAEKAAEGTLKINVFYSSALGDEQTALRQVVRGRIDMSGQSNTATSLVVPEISLLAAPFLFPTPKLSDCVFDNHVGEIFGPMLEARGLILISYVEVGYASVFSTVPIPTVADVKGVKMRIPPSNNMTFFYRETGAAGVPLGVVDMIPALKTGQVKAISTSTVYGVAIGLHKLGKYVIAGNTGVHDVGTVTVSKKTWKKLGKKQQNAIMLTANYRNDLRKSIRGAQKALLGKAAKEGADVLEVSGDVLKSWSAHAPAAQQALIEEIGPTAPGIWSRIISAKKACGG